MYPLSGEWDIKSWSRGKEQEGDRQEWETGLQKVMGAWIPDDLEPAASGGLWL